MLPSKWSETACLEQTRGILVFVCLYVFSIPAETHLINTKLHFRLCFNPSWSCAHSSTDTMRAYGKTQIHKVRENLQHVRPKHVRKHINNSKSISGAVYINIHIITCIRDKCCSLHCAVAAVLVSNISLVCADIWQLRKTIRCWKLNSAFEIFSRSWKGETRRGAGWRLARPPRRCAASVRSKGSSLCPWEKWQIISSGPEVNGSHSLSRPAFPFQFSAQQSWCMWRITWQDGSQPGPSCSLLLFSGWSASVTLCPCDSV